MTERQTTGRSYDRVAGDYAAQILDELKHKPFDRAMLDAFAEIAGGGNVADVGCGPGHVGALLAGRGVRTFGLDLSPGMCAIAHRSSSLPAVAGDMSALPLRSRALTGLICFYAVIHLDAAQRAAAYGEFARVLGDDGIALIAFHTSDAENRTGESRRIDEWWGHDVELTFHFLDADREVLELREAGLHVIARLDRAPHARVEHESNRSYLFVSRVTR
jgi:SAM-dependent methyltransferase